MRPIVWQNEISAQHTAGFRIAAVSLCVRWLPHKQHAQFLCSFHFGPVCSCGHRHAESYVGGAVFRPAERRFRVGVCTRLYDTRSNIRKCPVRQIIFVQLSIFMTFSAMIVGFWWFVLVYLSFLSVIESRIGADLNNANLL